MKILGYMLCLDEEKKSNLEAWPNDFLLLAKPI